MAKSDLGPANSSQVRKKYASMRESAEFGFSNDKYVIKIYNFCWCLYRVHPPLGLLILRCTKVSIYSLVL